jgi:hypothetical protein
MYDAMNPLFYCLSVFWGYRLLKHGTQAENRGKKILASVTGLVFLEAPWLIHLINLPGRILLFTVIAAVIVDGFLRVSTGKPVIGKMPLDEKLLWACIPFALGWLAWQLLIR